jgi:hypothetical protein
MRAMRRVRISSAAMREASSIWSHAVVDEGAREGLGGRPDWSRKARFNCIAALLARHRIDVSVVESVNDLAQVEQIAESAEIVAIITAIPGRCWSGLLCGPVGPVGRNERPAAIRQDNKSEEDAASPDATDHCE